QRLFLSLTLSVFRRLSSTFHRFMMGKQSSFSRHSALDALSALSSASVSNSALQAELKRTRRNVSILASRLREAQTTMGLMEEILFSLLPPAPPPPPPPELPPRPTAPAVGGDSP